MSNPNLRHIVIVLDRSGSMNAVKDDTEGGLAAFLEAQQENTGDTRVSLYQFDTKYEPVYENLALADVPAYTLEPRGRTALLDAIGRTITTVKAQVKVLDADERPGEVVLVVLTDGAENASREYTLEAVKQLIEKRRAKGWQVVFLGADQDAITVAATMGIDRGSSLSYSSRSTRRSMSSAGRMVSRGSASGRYEFTDEEREAAVAEEPQGGTGA
ncbi:Mg-chelatase subunit ChlD [Catenulispora sp. GP43]|uniref:vWA domain-containing protein n=1 Tax=Catenulispora sp. GP43 TaxID=3156263 RepID=UPI003513DB0D